MARALIVGCGCRGRELGRRLMAKGWQVRGTSRREEGLEEIAAAGIEPVLADPARIDTVLDLVGDVTAVTWFFGSAEGGDEELAALHGPRLDRMFERLVETPVRGFVYEAAGSVDPILLARGHESLEAAADRWQIPLYTLFIDPGDYDVWADPIEIWLDTVEHLMTDLAGQAP